MADYTLTIVSSLRHAERQIGDKGLNPFATGFEQECRGEPDVVFPKPLEENLYEERSGRRCTTLHGYSVKI
jgi:hypothetical protein